MELEDSGHIETPFDDVLYFITSTNGLSVLSLATYFLFNNSTMRSLVGFKNNEMSKFSANIIMSNDVPIIVWSPDLGSNRTYTIYGKSDLTDAEWFTPTNSAHRFFKVGVKLAE